MPYRHIFLTGQKQVGKSTIWRTVLADRQHTGFQTIPFHLDGFKRGYTFHSMIDLPDRLNDAPCVIRVNENRHAAVPAVFDGAGAEALRLALASECPVILMDELGKVERNCAAFLDAVTACLDSGEHHVLGVLQLGEAPMQQAVRAREDVLLLTVTEDNRGALCRQVEETLKSWGL